MALGLCWWTICKGLFVRGFPYPSRLRASGFWCFGGITQHFRGFAFFGFLSLSLFFSLFFLALFTHKSMHFFGVRSWAFSFGSSSFAELRNKGAGQGGKARGSGAFGGACFRSGFLYSSLMGRATHPPIGGRCAIIAQIEGHHVSIKERQSNKQQERNPFRH
jgi:hypothetical protein